MNQSLDAAALALTLPTELPIFPLPGVVLLPRGRLPLNVFEPRYLMMMEDALAAGRMVGILQPTKEDGEQPPLYKVGCVGRIVSFSETDDGRFLVALHGVCRFGVAEELPLQNGYRRIRPDWEPFTADLASPAVNKIDRTRMFVALRNYFKVHNITANWDAIQQTDDEQLVISLTMICPLEANEKQALLECATLAQRAELLQALLEMAALHQRDPEGARH